MGIIRTYIEEMIYFHVWGALGVGDGKAKVKMPYSGEILAYGGYVSVLGGGNTTIQLRNSTVSPDKDYFASAPSCLNASATGLLEGGLLIDSPTFNADDVVELDIDATTGTTLQIWALCGMFKAATI